MFKITSAVKVLNFPYFNHQEGIICGVDEVYRSVNEKGEYLPRGMRILLSLVYQLDCQWSINGEELCLSGERRGKPFFERFKFSNYIYLVDFPQKHSVVFLDDYLLELVKPGDLII